MDTLGGWLSEIRYFYKRQVSQPLSPCAQALWHYLMWRANGVFWQFPLRLSVPELAGGTLTAEIEHPGTGDVTASVRLYSAEGEESAPETREISLRIYSGNDGDALTVSYTDPEGETSSEEASWVAPKDNDAEPYWSVTWLGDGLYSY